MLLIGPGEWLLLGRLRRRRWTWATFPAIAAGLHLLHRAYRPSITSAWAINGYP
ncbi:MAG: hypothetical protein WDN28_22475 [Chthoniobacter sp.]